MREALADFVDEAARRPGFNSAAALQLCTSPLRLHAAREGRDAGVRPMLNASTTLSSSRACTSVC
jgi:hypothetical protein